MDEPLRNTDYAIPHSIPTLTGEENLQDWIIMVELALYPLDLSKYIETSVPEPNKAIKPKDWAVWRRQRGTIACMLQSTLHKVRHHLASAGMPLAERDPYIIFKTVKDVMCPLAKADGVNTIANRLSMCQVTDYSDLQAFRDDLKYMRLRLKQVGSCPPDSFLVAIFLNKVKTVLPQSHALLRHDNATGSLSWEQMMAAFDQVIFGETGVSAIPEVDYADDDAEVGEGYDAQLEYSAQLDHSALPLKGVVSATALPKSILERIFWCCSCQETVSSEWGHICHASVTPVNKHSDEDSKPLEPSTTTVSGTDAEDDSTVRRLPMMTSAITSNEDDHQGSIMTQTDSSESTTKKPKLIVQKTRISKVESTGSDSDNSSLKMAGTVHFDAVRNDGSVVKLAFKNAFFSPSRPRILSRSITSAEAASINDSVRGRQEAETTRGGSLRGSQKRRYSSKPRLFSNNSDQSRHSKPLLLSAKA